MIYQRLPDIPNYNGCLTILCSNSLLNQYGATKQIVFDVSKKCSKRTPDFAKPTKYMALF